MVTLEEAKGFMRVEYNDDDVLIEHLIEAAKQQCMDILREDECLTLNMARNIKVAILYCVSYLYEHREEADYNQLNLSLRALLSGERKAAF